MAPPTATTRRMRSTAVWRLVGGCLLLTTALVGLLSLVGVSADAAQGTCVITASPGGEGIGTIVLSFESDPSIALVQAPGWRYRVIAPDGEEDASGQRLAGTSGTLRFSTAGSAPGVYRIEVTADGDQFCQTSITVAGPTYTPEPPQQTGPSIELDCPDMATQGDRGTLTATVRDVNEPLSALWILPDGREAPGLQIDVVFATLGTLDLGFELRDGRGDVAAGSNCQVLVVIGPPATTTPGPAPTSTPVPEPTSTPVPAPATTTPVPEPTSTPVPAPATPVPQPTSTPEPEPPTTTPVPDSTTATVIPEPTTTPAPTATPESDPDPPPTLPPSQASLSPDDVTPDIGPDFETKRLAGKLLATWPKTLAVSEQGDITVELVAADWRDDLDPDPYTGGFKIVVTGPEIETREYPIYGVEGTLELELVVSQNLMIVNPFSDDDPESVRLVDFTRGGRDSARWVIEATNSGRATATIRSSYLKQAVTEDPLSDAELAATPIGNFNLDLVFDITATDRNHWLPISIASVAPVLLSPFVGVLGLVVTGWRRRTDDDGEPAVLPLAAAPAVITTQAGVGDELRDLGIVLSGGGTRASAFSLGVAMSLVDQRRYDRVGQIASVSGGSLTNGFLAGLQHRLGRPPRTVEDLRPLAAGIARRGLPLERSAQLFGVSVLASIAWIGWIIARAAPSRTQAASGVLAAALLFVGFAWLAYSWAGIRPAVRRWIPRFLGIDEDLTLRDLGAQPNPGRADINHVFTSTAPGASHVHLSNRRSVIDPLPPAKAANPPAITETGDAGGVTVARAVQASAAFPGLPHVGIDAEEMGFSTVSGRLPLRDGGTVDNLGHIGATLDGASGDGDDYRRALTEWDTISRWIVVDSSAEVRTRRKSRWQTRVLETFHLGFAADLAEIASTGAANTTHGRARQLIEQFAATGGGLYLHLRQSPVDACLRAMGDYEGAPEELRAEADWVATAVLSGAGIPPNFAPKSERQRVATQLLQVLRESESGDVHAAWAARARRNTSVPTTLSSLGDKRAAQLLHHGYVLAAINGALDFGWDLPNPTQVNEFRFASIVNSTG